MRTEFVNNLTGINCSHVKRYEYCAKLAYVTQNLTCYERTNHNILTGDIAAFTVVPRAGFGNVIKARPVTFNLYPTELECHLDFLPNLITLLSGYSTGLNPKHH